MRSAMRRTALAIVLSICAHQAALSQSNPNLKYGQVPTAGQWNNYFSVKQDVLGFTPLNAAGGSMAGPLFLLPASASGAGVNIGVGVTPSFPNNGDMWMTATGLFARINGSSVNISTGGSPSILFPATVSGTTNSGGMPYFSNSTTMSSTAVLGAGLLVKGGGAGVAPSTFTLGGGCTFATPNITCSAGSLSGATLAANVLNTSITGVGVLASGSTGAGFTLNLATSTVSGVLPQANSPALTGDVTKPSGSSTTSSVLTGDVTKSGGSTATTVAKIGGTSVGTPTGTAGTAVVLGTNANITTPTIAQPIINGDTSAATNAAVGQVGEVLAANNTLVGPGTGTTTNITSKSITAGHWLCQASVIGLPGGSTVISSVTASLSLTTGVAGASPFLAGATNTYANASITASTGPFLFNTTSTVTLFLVGQIGYSVSNANLTGYMQCNRIW